MNKPTKWINKKSKAIFVLSKEKKLSFDFGAMNGEFYDIAVSGNVNIKHPKNTHNIHTNDFCSFLCVNKLNLKYFYSSIKRFKSAEILPAWLCYFYVNKTNTFFLHHVYNFQWTLSCDMQFLQNNFHFVRIKRDLTNWWWSKIHLRRQKQIGIILLLKQRIIKSFKNQII